MSGAEWYAIPGFRIYKWSYHMLRRIHLSWVASGAMLVWLIVLGTRLRFGNQPWQDIFQILVGVLFIFYGMALVRNWNAAGEAWTNRFWVTHRDPQSQSEIPHAEPGHYRRAGYLWMFSGVLIIIAAIILIVTQVF